MLKRIIEIICDYVETDPAAITEETNLRTGIGASSFDLMNVAIAVEAEYGVRLPDSELPRVKTVGDLMRLLDGAREG